MTRTLTRRVETLERHEAATLQATIARWWRLAKNVCSGVLDTLTDDEHAELTAAVESGDSVPAWWPARLDAWRAEDANHQGLYDEYLELEYWLIHAKGCTLQLSETGAVIGMTVPTR